MVTLSVKLEESVVERIDGLTESMSTAAHGARLTRSTALRVIIEAGLAALEPKPKPRKR